MKWTRIILCMHLVLAVLLTATCAKRFNLPTSAPARERLFPDGLYRQKVKLTLRSKAEGVAGRLVSFTGVVALTPGAIQLSGVSPFLTTLFTLDDDLVSGKIVQRIMVDDLRVYEKEMLRIYQSLKPLLLAPISAVDFSQPDQEGLRVAIAAESEIWIRDFNHQLLPSRLSMQHADFQVDVRLESYKP